MSVLPRVESPAESEMDQRCINTIRTLSIDAVQQAKSGHPGTPMALAPLVYTMWNRGDAVRSARSNLAQSRSVRAVERSRIDVALVSSPSHEDTSGERRLREPRPPFGHAR
jgi:hypothetical protein